MRVQLVGSVEDNNYESEWCVYWDDLILAMEGRFPNECTMKPKDVNWK